MTRKSRLSKTQAHVLEMMAGGQTLERDGWDAPWRLPDGETVRQPTYWALEEAGLVRGNGEFFGAARITAKGRRTVEGTHSGQAAS